MSEKKSPGQLFNEEMLRQQRERNAALNKKAAEEKAKEYEISTTRDPNEPNKPSEKGGYKRRRRRSTKRKRRSSRKRRRTMRR